MNKNTTILIAVLICIIGGIAVWMAFVQPPTEMTKIKVFHAGSLALPFDKVEKEFEDQHPDVDLQRKSSGSVRAVREITDVGEVADVIAVADYSLIPDMMEPKYADWHVRFAKNEMVIAYTDQSKYANGIKGDNWYEILERPDVRFGFSNPNLDPCGYRTLMVFKLADIYYGTHVSDILTENTKITIDENGGRYLVKVPDRLNQRGEVTIRNKSVDLIHLVKANEIDYAFEYRSVAIQHGLKFVDLPPEIDLSNVNYKDLYKQVEVMDATGKVITGKPIVYGITVPKNAINKELGIEFVKFVIGDEGQKIFRDFGQIPIAPAVGVGNVPLELSTLIEKGENVVRLATGSPYELGLIDALTKPFEEKNGCNVEVTKAGSGKALDLARAGKVDLVIVHAPAAEEKIVAAGYGLGRTPVMYNDFVIVGPKNDPAGIKGMTDVADAYRKIAENRSLFFSRGDDSGTHKKEMAIWDEVGITPGGDWYQETGEFMGATLKIADENEGYFMTDRSTYIAMRDDLNLEILVEGDPDLVNYYSAIAVNPEKYPNINYELTRTFIEYIVSPEGRTIIENFGRDKYGEPLYHLFGANMIGQEETQKIMMSE